MTSFNSPDGVKDSLKLHLNSIPEHMQGTLHRYVEFDPAKYDGKPVISGTRVPVQF